MAGRLRMQAASVDRKGNVSLCVRIPSEVDRALRLYCLRGHAEMGRVVAVAVSTYLQHHGDRETRRRLREYR